MGWSSCFGSASRHLTLVGTLLSLLSCVLSLLAFFLPFWIYMAEVLRIPGRKQTAYFQYNYGFWRYCNSVTSSSRVEYNCGDVTTHYDWEQVTACLVLVGVIFQLNGVLNGSLRLVIFVNEKLCLHIAGASAGIAGMLMFVAVVLYGTQDHSVHLRETLIIPFKFSHLHASFWCAVSSCVLSFLVTIVFVLANATFTYETVRPVTLQLRNRATTPIRATVCNHERRLNESGETRTQKDFEVGNALHINNSLTFPDTYYDSEEEYLLPQRCIVYKNYSSCEELEPNFQSRKGSQIRNPLDNEPLDSTEKDIAAFETTVETVQRTKVKTKLLNACSTTTNHGYKSTNILLNTNKEIETVMVDKKVHNDEHTVTDQSEEHFKSICRVHADRNASLHCTGRSRSKTDLSKRKVVAQEYPKHLVRSAWTFQSQVEPQ